MRSSYIRKKDVIEFLGVLKKALELNKGNDIKFYTYKNGEKRYIQDEILQSKKDS